MRRRALVRFDQQRGGEHTARGLDQHHRLSLVCREEEEKKEQQKGGGRETLDYRDSGGLSLGEGKGEMLRWRMSSEIQRNEARETSNTPLLD